MTAHELAGRASRHQYQTWCVCDWLSPWCGSTGEAEQALREHLNAIAAEKVALAKEAEKMAAEALAEMEKLAP